MRPRRACPYLRQNIIQALDGSHFAVKEGRNVKGLD